MNNREAGYYAEDWLENGPGKMALACCLPLKSRHEDLGYARQSPQISMDWTYLSHPERCGLQIRDTDFCPMQQLNILYCGSMP